MLEITNTSDTGLPENLSTVPKLAKLYLQLKKNMKTSVYDLIINHSFKIMVFSAQI